MKALKALLIKTGGRYNSDNFDEGLLELRNTPRAGGKSPAEIVFGQPIRSRLPIHHSAFDKKWLTAMDDYDRKASELQVRFKNDYDKHAHELPYLAIGTTIRLQDPITKHWDKTAVIQSRGRHRNYRVRLPSGRCYWRNRRFLRPTHASDPAEDITEDESSPTADARPKRARSTPASTEDDTKTPRRSKRIRFAPTRLGD